MNCFLKITENGVNILKQKKVVWLKLKNNWEKNINDIFLRYSGIDFIKNRTNIDKKLMGTELGIAPRTLVYIYCKIEEELGISIPVKEVVDGNFDTFGNVCKMVSKIV